MVDGMKRQRWNGTPVGPRLESLIADLGPWLDRVDDHRIYGELARPGAAEQFMSHHVFAVWDFMSLVKSLQCRLTSVGVPWAPRGSAMTRRFINELVLEEESDEHPAGGYTSHFELYLEAMTQRSVSTSMIEGFVSAVQIGLPIADALNDWNVPGPSADFVARTWSVIDGGASHELAAAFAFGREVLIPDMFRGIEDAVRLPGPEIDLFLEYLSRHIELDGDRHGPFALRLIEEMCGNDDSRWEDASRAAVESLESRLALWDGITEAICQTRSARSEPIDLHEGSVLPATGGFRSC